MFYYRRFFIECSFITLIIISFILDLVFATGFHLYSALVINFLIAILIFIGVKSQKIDFIAALDIAALQEIIDAKKEAAHLKTASNLKITTDA